MNSDERREVAERLRRRTRETNGTHDFTMYLSHWVGVVGPTVGEGNPFTVAANRRLAERTLEKLADLVDPTCNDFGGEEGTNGEGYDFACSACGWCGDVCEPNYCPNCGARVVQQ